eukprot:TRINITY_DN12692_c0_g1_i1.p1 TRINITY_DN12692_c0_g1~~TRINITY_DN12692_c0_g1_i1.p1  ORF type:complete len:245 (-),score=39.10 TRINITY_DN12692_c0_g1_i1:499-1233(-)
MFALANPVHDAAAPEALMEAAVLLPVTESEAQVIHEAPASSGTVCALRLVMKPVLASLVGAAIATAYFWRPPANSVVVVDRASSVKLESWHKYTAPFQMEFTRIVLPSNTWPCMDVDENSRLSANPNCHGMYNQLFRLSQKKEILCKPDYHPNITGCLEVQEDEVVMCDTCSGHLNQQWSYDTLDDDKNTPVEMGIVKSDYTGQCLTAGEFSVIVSDCRLEDNQFIRASFEIGLLMRFMEGWVS